MTASSRSASDLGQPLRKARSSAVAGSKQAAREPASRTEPIATTAGDEPSRHGVHYASVVGAGAVDLVDEDQGRDAHPAKRPHEQRRLGLDALDRRHHEHRAVEHAEDALDLGDEVGVAGRVDDVDGELADDERGDRGPDRDAAFALEV